MDKTFTICPVSGQFPCPTHVSVPCPPRSNFDEQEYPEPVLIHGPGGSVTMVTDRRSGLGGRRAKIGRRKV